MFSMTHCDRCRRVVRYGCSVLHNGGQVSDGSGVLEDGGVLISGSGVLKNLSRVVSNRSGVVDGRHVLNRSRMLVDGSRVLEDRCCVVRRRGDLVGWFIVAYDALRGYGVAVTLVEGDQTGLAYRQHKAKYGDLKDEILTLFLW
ncbi:hypothetical protein EVAR_63043_1 [Eumeta japonica]|uniref:Uncharacterized protein n=1 Tax=Eumeta variegata TaxID=151549 RepID=A0A4C1Z4F5_EUMVA|nr:hypothetical protein EVAR_63043_1 [Eumeta japonica]